MISERQFFISFALVLEMKVMQPYLLLFKKNKKELLIVFTHVIQHIHLLN